MPTISLLTEDSPTTLSPPLRRRFTGSYMQVLPDDRDSYHSIHGEGSFTMTGLEYVIDVAQAGRHTLYLRWSGGDDRGAGDSLYVVNVSSWIRGGSDASAYIRNGDSARGSSTTAAMTAAGLGAPVNLSAPMGASNYQPPV